MKTTIIVLVVVSAIVTLFTYKYVGTFLEEGLQDFDNLAHYNDYGYVDRTGKIVLKRQFGSAGDFSENLAAVCCENGKFGFIDKSGTLVIQPQFDSADKFSDGFAAVRIGENWGYIDKSGTLKIAPQFQFAGPFSTGLASIVRPGDDKVSCTFIDKTGKNVHVLPGFYVEPKTVPFESTTGFSDGLLPVIEDETGKYGFVGADGKLAIKAQFDEAHPFSEGLAPALVDGHWGYIDKSGVWVIQPQYQDARSFSDGAGMVGINGKWSFIDRTGKKLFEESFDASDGFSEGLAQVRIGSKRGLIDKSGHFVQDKIPCANVHEGLAAFPYKTWSDDVGQNEVQIWNALATRNIAAGETITDEDVVLQKVQARFVPQNAEISLSKVIGTTASHAIPENGCFTK